MTKNKKIAMLSTGVVVAVAGVSAVAITNTNKKTNKNINNHSVPTIGNYSAGLKSMNLPAASSIANQKIDTINKCRPLLQGLKSGNRSQIFQDKDGNIWFMGNGTPLQVLKSGSTIWEEANHKNNIVNGWGGKILQDKDGNIWSAGYNTPLQVLKADANGHIDFSKDWEEAGHGNKISKGQHSSIVQNKNGDIYTMGIYNNIQVLKADANGHIDLNNTNWQDVGNVKDGPQNGDNGKIFADSQGRIWVLSQEGIYLWENSKWVNYTPFFQYGGWGARMEEDDNGTLWMVDHAGIVYTLKKGHTSWKIVSGIKELKPFDKSKDMSEGSMLKDKDGNIWLLKKNTQLHVLKKGATKWAAAGNGNNIIDGSTGKIYQTRNGDIYAMGSGTQLQVLRHGKTQWENVGNGVNIINGSGGNMFEDKDGNLYAIGYDGWLHVLKKGRTEWTNHREERTKFVEPANKEQKDLNNRLSSNTGTYSNNAKKTVKTAEQLKQEIGTNISKLNSILGINLSGLKHVKIKEWKLIAIDGKLTFRMITNTVDGTQTTSLTILEIKTLNLIQVVQQKAQDADKVKKDAEDLLKKNTSTDKKVIAALQKAVNDATTAKTKADLVVTAANKFKAANKVNSKQAKAELDSAILIAKTAKDTADASIEKAKNVIVAANADA
ncbi:MAG: hypothetical protein HRT98_02625, partial [Mycoplasmatales bacterium]|nr:hypothetical protein [Mycoplasmatales bacterium]